MNLPVVARELWDDFLNTLFPQACLACNTILVYQEQHICTKCRFSLPKTDYHLHENNLLLQKFAYEPKVRHAAAYLHYLKGGVAQRIVRKLKYENVPEIGTMIGEWYGHELAKSAWRVDFIVPVPLHLSKLKKRGYNQSEEFAKGLSRALNVPVRTDLVIRKRNTSTQTQKTRVQRWQNMDSVYDLATSGSVFETATVLVVDDVLTTGATVGELVALLVAHGVGAVYIAAMATGK